MKNNNGFIIAVLICVFICSMCVINSADARRSDLRTDGNGTKIQNCAPTLKNDTNVTGNSQTISVDGANCWKIYVANAIKFRTMSTATKVGVQHTMPGGTWNIETVSDYKFVNFSTVGATGTFRSDKP